MRNFIKKFFRGSVGERPILVKIITNQFILGVILGAISGYIVNIATEQYGYKAERQRYISMLLIELNKNEIIASNNARNESFFSHFETQVWDSGLANGYILDLKIEELSTMNAVYNQMKSINSYIDEWMNYRTMAEIIDSALSKNIIEKNQFENSYKIYEGSRIKFIKELSNDMKKHLQRFVVKNQPNR